MDLASVNSFNDIMDFAIEKEEEAAKLYGELAKQGKTSGIKEMFLDLSKQEEGHKARLQALSREGFPEKGEAKVPDLKISDFLVDVKITPESSYQDVLIFAMKREEASVTLYGNLAKYSTDAGAKKLFEALADEEGKHKRKLETEYDENVLKDN